MSSSAVMSFPTRTAAGDSQFKRSSGRVRASSFNHTTAIRKQHSDSFFNSPLSKHEATITRRPSFDTHQRQQQQRQSIIQHGNNSNNNFLTVNTNTNGASSIDDSGSDDDLYHSSQHATIPMSTDQNQFIGKKKKKT